MHPNCPTYVLTTLPWNSINPYENRPLSKTEYLLCSSFPLDYDFCEKDPYYVMGMSVPPVMMAQISHAVYEQWIQNIKGEQP
jgi:DNA (cytosine-5)-methyltransferase 1